MPSKHIITNTLQDIADRARKHWLISLFIFASFMIGITWRTIDLFIVTPQVIEIANLKQQRALQNPSYIYIFNVNNLKIEASPLEGIIDSAKPLKSVDIAILFQKSFKEMSGKKPPIEINNSPATLIKEDIKVIEKPNGVYSVYAGSNIDGGKASVKYKTMQKGNTLEFIPENATGSANP